MHEPRAGYYTWRDPRDGKTHILGRMPLAQAMHEAGQANLVVANSKATSMLSDRLMVVSHSIDDLIAKMSTDDLKPNTIYARKTYDRVISERFGKRVCQSITTVEVSDLIEEIKKRGKMRWAQAIRKRMITIFTKGVALGWMDKNPALVTESVKVKVKRQRLTIEQFNLILAEAEKMSPWLPNAMLLALVSGQDRSTVAQWPRNSVQDGDAVVFRQKTSKWIAIPIALRMNAICLSLADVITRCKSTGVVSKYLVHHTENRGSIKRGAPIQLSTISNQFLAARRAAGIPDENAPSFHELRSLCKRLYVDQGGVDTKALLGHSTDAIADLYQNNRGVAPIKVRVSAA